jgi:hypothetical protein
VHIKGFIENYLETIKEVVDFEPAVDREQEA